MAPAEHSKLGKIVDKDFTPDTQKYSLTQELYNLTTLSLKASHLVFKPDAADFNCHASSAVGKAVDRTKQSGPGWTSIVYSAGGQLPVRRGSWYGFAPKPRACKRTWDAGSAEYGHSSSTAQGANMHKVFKRTEESKQSLSVDHQTRPFQLELVSPKIRWCENSWRISARRPSFQTSASA